MSFILLFIGFVILIKSADILVDSASKLAKMLAIPSFIVGLTVVAFGTSAPELVIGVVSGIKQNNLIALGDVIGACIANSTFILGVAAVIFPVAITKSALYEEIPLLFGIQLLLFAMITFGSGLSKVDAVILIILFFLFLIYIIRQSKHAGLEAVTAAGRSKGKLAVLLLLSLIGITIGGNLVVNSSTTIAHMFGMSEVLIGVTVVAIGTTLPELVTTVVAALKRQSNLAIGNIIGSNIFNILLVLGVSSYINPIPKAVGINVDIFIMIFATLLVFLIALPGKVSRFRGIVLITLYGSFIIYKVVGLL